MSIGIDPENYFYFNNLGIFVGTRKLDPAVEVVETSKSHENLSISV